MTGKPPEKDGSSLEVDSSGVDEYRLREEQLQRERALKAEEEVRDQNERVEALMAAEKESMRPEEPLVTRKSILGAVLFFLLTYFCLLALFDLINFLEGVRVLGSEAIQLAGGTLASVWCYRSLNRILESRKAQGPLWKATSAITVSACLIVALYLLILFFRNIPRGSSGGGKNFLFFLVGSGLLLWWLAMVRKKTLLAIQDYRSIFLENKLVFVEGIMLNILLMVIFQYISGANVAVALLNALAAPKYLFFMFSPLVLYFSFRKMLAGFFYH